MKTDHPACDKPEPTNQAPAVSSLPRLSTNGTFIWLTDDKTLINQRGEELAIELDYSMFSNRAERQTFAEFFVTACNSHAANLSRIAELESLLSRTYALMTDPKEDDPFMLDMLESDIAAALAKQ